MRKGPYVTGALPMLLLAAALAGPGASTCRAQAVGSLSEPVLQQSLETMDQRPFNARLAAMGGAYIAVDDVNNLINLWRLDRNPAALLEDVQGTRVEFDLSHYRPRTSYGPSESDAGRYESGFQTHRLGGVIGQARWRDRVAAQAEVGYRGVNQTDMVSLGAQKEFEGAGPRLALTLNRRIGKLYIGGSFDAYNVDESALTLYDTTYFPSVQIDRMVNAPPLVTDRVSYHAIRQVGGLQFEVLNGLRFGGTFGLEQQRIDGASANERMQLDAINNRNLIRESIGGIYRYRDRLVMAARFHHNSYDATETFRFSRRKKSAVQDLPVVYNGRVADHRWRLRAFDARGQWRIDPRHLQVGFAYSAGKEETYRQVAVGVGSYNYLDSLYLMDTPEADSVGVSPAALVGNASRVNDYVKWGMGGQYHPNPRATLAVDYSRYTADLKLDGVGVGPDYRTLRVGGEYTFPKGYAIRAGYVHLKLDEDRNKLIDKRQGHQLTFGLGYTKDSRKSLELVYLTGDTKSDVADPSHLEVRERGLNLYGRVNF
jgi:predicted porin